MWLLKFQFGFNLPSPAAVIPVIAVKKLIIRPWVGSISCGFPCLGHWHLCRAFVRNKRGYGMWSPLELEMCTPSHDTWTCFTAQMC
ncbi:hypothetical protein ACE6H2_023300 [Prunus campanulata]